MIDDAAVAVAPTDAGSSPADVSSVETTPESTETTPVETSPVETTPEVVEGEQPKQDETQPESKTEEDLKEFNGSVAAKLRELSKANPALAQAMQANPKLRDTLAATFRREEGFRESFPTVAEARQMREYFPRGVEDAKALISEIEEVSELDRQFESTDPVTQEQFIQNLDKNNPKAFRSLAAGFPRVWAKIDPDGYNKTFSRIIGATFEQNGIPEFIQSLKASVSDKPEAARMVEQLEQWMNGYSTQGRKKTPEQEALERRQAELDERDRRSNEDKTTQFREGFKTQETTAQFSAINKILENRLPTTVSKEKRERIATDIRQRIVNALGGSPAFMRSLNRALSSGDMNEALAVSRGGWQRLVPAISRKVLEEELAGVVTGNQQTIAKKRATAAKTDVGSGVAPTGQAKPGKFDPSTIPGFASMTMLERLQAAKKQAGI